MIINRLSRNRKFFSKRFYTVFDKIINKELPSKIVYEDEYVLAFHDINPAANTHILIIPKNNDGLTGISKAEDRHIEILGRMLLTAKKIGEQLGIKDGYRLVINEGENAGQSVFHIHLHLLAGSKFTWPPGTYNNRI